MVDSNIEYLFNGGFKYREFVSWRFQLYSIFTIEDSNTEYVLHSGFNYRVFVSWRIQIWSIFSTED